MEEVSLVVAFGAGLLSFLSPCVVPLVPVYLASLAGPEILERGGGKRLSVFLHSLSFVAGFSAVFVLLGAGAGLVGFLISQHLDLVRRIAGSLLVASGVFMLAALKVSWLNYERALLRSRPGAGHARSLLTGVVFSLAWTPCVSPILGGILAFAMTSETAWQGAYLLSVYSLGMALPFLAAGAVFEAATPLLKRASRYAPVFYVSSSVILIGVGVLVLANKLTWFNQFAT